MKEFVGQACDALVAREFWLGDRRVSAAYYVFLSLDDGTAIGWWFDDDPCIWRWESVDVVAIPDTDEGRSDYDGTDWRYPIVDLASNLGLRGRPVARWIAIDCGPVPEARLEFADGASIVFAYDCRRESDWVQIGVKQS